MHPAPHEAVEDSPPKSPTTSRLSSAPTRRIVALADASRSCAQFADENGASFGSAFRPFVSGARTALRFVLGNLRELLRGLRGSRSGPLLSRRED